MTRIWKFNLPPLNSIFDNAFRFTLRMPRESKILSVKQRNGSNEIWIAVNPDNPIEEIWFASVGTGHGIIPEGYSFIDTIIEEPYVWHLFVESKAH